MTTKKLDTRAWWHVAAAPHPVRDVRPPRILVGLLTGEVEAPVAEDRGTRASRGSRG